MSFCFVYSVIHQLLMFERILGLRKVTADMKTKNRADRSGVVHVSEKEGRTAAPSVSKVGPPKLELQMGRK